MNNLTWSNYKKGLLKNQEFRGALDEMAPEFQLAKELIRLRSSLKITQAELAQRAGTSQVVIARLESGEANPQLETIEKVARGLGKRLTLKFS